MLPRIKHLPAACKEFFGRFRCTMESAHFAHCWQAVLLVAVLHGRRSLSGFTAATAQRRTRQAISHFLGEDLWDGISLLRQKAWDTLRRLGWRAGQPIYIVLDDTQKRKRGKKMDAVKKLFLHAEKVYAPAHIFVTCALVYRGVVIPYAVRLWLPKEFSRGEGLPFRKLTELAAEMLGQFSLPGKGKVIALFDSYYLCPAVVQTCEARGWAYISVAKKNRNFFPQGRDRDKRKLGRYGRNVLRRNGHAVKAGGKPHRVAERLGRLSKVGEVKLIFSRRVRERAWVVLVTNQRQWSAKTVLSHYQQRWVIEVLFKMAKQHLGLGDYQVLRYRAIENYLRLVYLAYLLLTHQALRASDVQAALKKRHSVLRLASIPQLQMRLRATLWDDFVRRLENRPKQRSWACKIKELLQNCG
jgi:SRSO17 transposase